MDWCLQDWPVGKRRETQGGDCSRSFPGDPGTGISGVPTPGSEAKEDGRPLPSNGLCGTIPGQAGRVLKPFERSDLLHRRTGRYSADLIHNRMRTAGPLSDLAFLSYVLKDVMRLSRS
jgi:hypothetical protein